MSQETAEIRQRVSQFQTDFKRLTDEIGKEIVGYQEIVRTYPRTQAAGLAEDYIRDMDQAGGG